MVFFPETNGLLTLSLRISLGDLLIVLPVHLVVMVSTLVFSQRVLSDEFAATAMKTVDYVDDKNLNVSLG